MSFNTITLTPDHGKLFLSLIVMNVHCYMVGASIGGQRRKHGIKYPDMGNGRYSAKLSDKDWEEFNNYQRVHYNYLEDLNLVNMIGLIGGLRNPEMQFYLNIIYIFGRMLYGWGYTTNGAQGRIYGSVFAFIGKVGMLGYAINTGLNVAGLV